MSVTKPDTRFKETMGAFFHDLLRAAGITMTPGNSHERIRQIGERMAAAIEHASERKSIQVIRKLQTAVSEAFSKMETVLEKVRTVVGLHEVMLENIHETQKKQAAQIEHLKADVKSLTKDLNRIDPSYNPAPMK
jgi:hypothetical protein